MKLEYDNITNEQWEIYRAVENACRREDLKDVLEYDYERDINEFSDADIDMVLELCDGYRSDSGEWREDFHNAIDRILDL